MKNFYPFQVTDLIFPANFINRKKIQLFQEYGSNPNNAHRNARLYAILIKHRELKMISDGNRISQIKVL